MSPSTNSFDTLPDSALIREAQLVQSPKRPGVPAPLPFSAPTLWRMVKARTFPQPVKLSAKVTAWRVGEVREWLRSLSGEAVPTLPTPPGAPPPRRKRNLATVAA
jgi:prophage regulatory protein